jgi:hypothetical protein
MRKILSFFFSILMLLNCSQTVDDLEKKNKTLEIFQKFQVGLQKELSSSIEKTGLKGAVSNCKLISPAKEREFLEENQIEIKRVSEKNRNPEHKPDEWETIVLQKWQSDLSEGKEISVSFTKTSNGLRVMKPILIENGVCLHCHGKSAEMDPDLLTHIRDLYPEDKAVDYEMKQLRGAFSAIWPDKVQLKK